MINLDVKIWDQKLLDNVTWKSYYFESSSNLKLPVTNNM